VVLIHSILLLFVGLPQKTQKQLSQQFITIIVATIDFHEGDKVDGEALKALVRVAVALNISSNQVYSSGSTTSNFFFCLY
jgi:hypothetical protein